MSDDQKPMAFLGALIRYADTAEHDSLKKKITQAQRDERCVWRAAELMILLITLALAGLGYAAVFLENYASYASQIILMFFCILGLTSLLSLLFYLVCWGFYRQDLNRQRDACLHLAMKLLEARLD